MTLIPWQEILPQIRRTFRNSFVYPHKKVTQWFPGHMNRGFNFENIFLNKNAVLIS